MDLFKPTIEQPTSPEIMQTPEIVIEEEKGAQLFSLLLKAENPNWGETETQLAKETTDYFQQNPIEPEIIETIKSLQVNGVDEETLYNLALTYKHPERAKYVFEMAQKYKPHVKNPEDVYKKLITVLEKFDQTFSTSPLAEKFATEIELDKKERLKILDENKNRVESLINFYKPNPKTTNVKKLNFVPTDPLYKKNSGRNFSAFPEEQIIISHIENIGNQNHEFSHGIINPIVEKLSSKLSKEQKEKISQLASQKLKQDYGNDYFSLLCEEFIRTYGDVFVKGEEPETYENFNNKLNSLTEEKFQEIITESNSLKNRLNSLDINSAKSLKEKSLEYFNTFEKNELREIIFNFYKKYSSRQDKNQNFETFVLNNFPNLV